MLAFSFKKIKKKKNVTNALQSPQSRASPHKVKYYRGNALDRIYK